MRLNKYLRDRGILKSWFSRKTGIHPSSVSGFCTLREVINEKHWDAITQFTYGKVTRKDIREQNDEINERKALKKKKQMESKNRRQFSKNL